MTPLQKRRHSTGRQGRRRAEFKLPLGHLLPCPNCKQPMRAHEACPHCGFYKGKKVK